MARSIDPIARWRHLAEEYRTIADATRDDSARATYLGLAAEADRLANRLAETAARAIESRDPVVRKLLAEQADQPPASGGFRGNHRDGGLNGT